MLLPQTKEREYRFRLALRMGLPLFALVLAFVTYSLIGNFKTLETSFIVETLLILIFSIYFIFYLIYRGFDVKITDDVSKTFSREYLYTYLKEQLRKKDDYTLILISIDNLHDINTQYGIKNGDRVLRDVAAWIGKYLKSKNIENFPLGHIKGGDFIMGLGDLENQYATILDILCLKASDLNFENIEVKLSGAICDTSFSHDLDHIIEKLFELQENRRESKEVLLGQNIHPNELESLVVNAIEKRAVIITSQDVYEENRVVFKECYIKLKGTNEKMLYPKTYLKAINRLGLNIEYDLMILEEIVLSLEENEKTVYCLNVSPTSLRNEKFLQKCTELLQNSRIKLMFILSEQEYFSHTSKFNAILKSLKKMGILICITRLGSLHSSFLYLRELNIDIVRFDTYYSNQLKLEKFSNVVDGFTLMAHEKGVKTWLKNIENEETLKLAKKLNIDYLQGKYLGSLEKIYEN